MSRIGLRLAAFAHLLLLVFILTNCAPAYRGEPIAGPLDISAEPQLVLGQRVFYENCHQCHPGGTAGIGPSLNNVPLPGGVIKLVVRNGLVVMPSFSEARITEEELDALVAYMLKLRDHGRDEVDQQVR
jgi:mono/diheme cytochrome c family protein